MDMSEGLSIYQKRLLTCAAIVRNGKDPFNMDTWARKEECGTVRCAVGDYCISGVSDLHLAPDPYWSSGNWLIPMLPDGKSDWAAVRAHFHLSDLSALDLFSATLNAGKGRATVADRIEHFALHEHVDAKVRV